MIHQMNIYGKDKVQQAIERFKTFEPDDGYYLAFSGGKDSVVIKALADMAGVKYDAHYNITSCDPPELIQFIKREHPDVEFSKPRYTSGEFAGKQVTMWNLIPKNHKPPTRRGRYCCAYLKEEAGFGRFVVTGVRWDESVRRKENRGGLEVSDFKKTRHELIDPDNPDQEMIHNCMQKRKRILNPIVDWDTSEVWEFIREYNVPYCSLYDEGFRRLGCIGCPMAGGKGIEKEFERWPKYKDLYLHAFERMIYERRHLDKIEQLEKYGNKWETAEDVMKWYLNQ